MLIVDSQVHIWHDAMMPHHHRQVSTYSKDDLLTEMDANGIDAALICPPSVLSVGGNAWSIEAAHLHPERLAVMGWFELDKPMTVDALKTWAARNHNYGARWAMMQPAQRAWWSDGTMDWLWPAAEQAGLPLAFLVHDKLAEFAKVAARHPGLKMTIDHVGRTLGKVDAACFADLDDMLALARLPNVSVKLSGAPGYSSGPYPYRSIHDYLHRIVDAFGPARCFWGTDITRMPCSWRQCATMFTEEMAWLKGRELELVMGKALCDWLGWDLEGIRAGTA